MDRGVLGGGHGRFFLGGHGRIKGFKDVLRREVWCIVGGGQERIVWVGGDRGISRGGGGVMTYSEGIDIYFDVNRNNKRSHCILGSLKGVVFMFKKWL